MGRPPCCDKVGIKKGPWTPEEDIILVTYIQDHGPGNWRSVPTNTGLMRCSKSCRLRWTNYLRPGIKRGNFTPHEEGIIIHLQASLGNRWAAIASYLPQRTDNDIKNYWNTHLKKKIDKYQPVMDLASCSKSSNTGCHDFMPPNLGKSDLRTSYASSTENISKLLEGWMSSFRKDNVVTQGQDKQHEATNIALINSSTVSSACFKAKQIKNEGETCCGSIEELESLLLINNSSSIEWAKSQPEEAFLASDTAFPDHSDHEDKRLETQHLPLTLLEDWLLDEVTGQEDLLELSAEYSSV